MKIRDQKLYSPNWTAAKIQPDIQPDICFYLKAGIEDPSLDGTYVKLFKADAAHLLLYDGSAGTERNLGQNSLYIPRETIKMIISGPDKYDWRTARGNIALRGVNGQASFLYVDEDKGLRKAGWWEKAYKRGITKSKDGGWVRSRNVGGLKLLFVHKSNVLTKEKLQKLVDTAKAKAPSIRPEATVITSTEKKANTSEYTKRVRLLLSYPP